MSNLKIFNVGIDDDTNVIIEDVNMDAFDFKDCILVEEFGMCTPVVDIDSEVESLLKGETGTWMKSTGEYDKFMKGIKKLKKLKEKMGGIVVNWAVEYDANIGLVYNESEEDIMTFLTREHDYNN